MSLERINLQLNRGNLSGETPTKPGLTKKRSLGHSALKPRLNAVLKTLSVGAPGLGIVPVAVELGR